MSRFLKNQRFPFAKDPIKGLPASAFAKDINHMGQPARALQPVLLQAKLDPIRIALLNSFKNVFVLFDREVKIFND